MKGLGICWVGIRWTVGLWDHLNRHKSRGAWLMPLITWLLGCFHGGCFHTRPMSPECASPDRYSATASRNWSAVGSPPAPLLPPAAGDREGHPTD
jgi:hypothetical protein